MARMTQLTAPHDERALDQEIGERVHMLMFRRKMSQTAMAPSMGITQSTLSGKLRGRVTWSAQDLRNASRSLGTSVSYLVGETTDPRPVGPNGDQDLARPEGLEPPTFWLGASQRRVRRRLKPGYRTITPIRKPVA